MRVIGWNFPQREHYEKKIPNKNVIENNLINVELSAAAVIFDWRLRSLPLLNAM